MLITFTNWSMKTPSENVDEIYINHHTEGKSFRVRVLDDSKVEINTYSNSVKISKLLVANKVIYEGENNDVDYPHIYPNRK